MAEGFAIHGMSEDDVVDVHGKLAVCLRSIGLTGASLDHALAGAFRATAEVIERDREVASRRSATLSLVE